MAGTPSNKYTKAAEIVGAAGEGLVGGIKDAVGTLRGNNPTATSGRCSENHTVAAGYSECPAGHSRV